MKLIPEQYEWLKEQLETDAKKASSALESQQELSNVERYKASAYGNQDGATGADQTMFEQALYYGNQAAEYRGALQNVQLPTPDVDSDEVQIGSYVTAVDTITYANGETSVREFSVLLIEGELGNRSALDIKCASDTSAMGKALLGAKQGTIAVFKTSRGKTEEMLHSCRIKKVDNNYIYVRYAKYYDEGSFDLSGYTR